MLQFTNLFLPPPNNSGRERRERVSQLTWCGEGCFDARPVNSTVKLDNMNSMTNQVIRFERVVPQFTVLDLVKTGEYYRDVLGFQITGYWDGERVTLTPDAPPVFAIVRRDDVQVFFNRADQSDVRTGRAAGAYDAFFQIIGVDALAAELHSRGADILEGPQTRVYKQREIVVRDCNGLILCFAEDTSEPAT